MKDGPCDEKQFLANANLPQNDMQSSPLLSTGERGRCSKNPPKSPPKVPLTGTPDLPEKKGPVPDYLPALEENLLRKWKDFSRNPKKASHYGPKHKN